MHGHFGFVTVNVVAEDLLSHPTSVRAGVAALVMIGVGAVNLFLARRWPLHRWPGLHATPLTERPVP